MDYDKCMEDNLSMILSVLYLHGESHIAYVAKMVPHTHKTEVARNWGWVEYVYNVLYEVVLSMTDL